MEKANQKPEWPLHATTTVTSQAQSEQGQKGPSQVNMDHGLAT